MKSFSNVFKCKGRKIKCRLKGKFNLFGNSPVALIPVRHYYHLSLLSPAVWFWILGTLDGTKLIKHTILQLHNTLVDKFWHASPQYENHSKHYKTQWFSRQTQSCSCVPEAPAGRRDFKSLSLSAAAAPINKTIWEEADVLSWLKSVVGSDDDVFIKQEPQSDQNHGSYYHTVCGVTVSLHPVVHSSRWFPVFVSGVLTLHDSKLIFL